MNSLLITGYKAFELGILTAKDPRLPIIKEAIRRDLVRYLEEGVKWLIFTGNLGFEAWALEVAQELKTRYSWPRFLCLKTKERTGMRLIKNSSVALSRLILSSMPIPLIASQANLKNTIHFC